MLGAFSESLKVVVDRTVQLVLDAARTWLEVARSARLYIAAKLNERLVEESSSGLKMIAYLLLPAVVARALHARLVLSLGRARGRVLHQPIFTTVVHAVVCSIAPLPLPGRAISND